MYIFAEDIEGTGYSLTFYLPSDEQNLLKSYFKHIVNPFWDV